MNKKHYIIVIIIIFIDQITKILLTDKNITIIPNLLKLTYTENMGGAFSIGTPFAITILSILIIIGIIVFLTREKDEIKNYTPYVLILAGSASNVFDRIFRGFVIDFIDINIFNFPNFNIADISIVLGVFILTVLLMKRNSKIDEK